MPSDPEPPRPGGISNGSMNFDPLITRPSILHETLGNCHPQLSRSKVWCKTCGREQSVNSAECLRSGWPKCCGYTLTIGIPEPEAPPHAE